MFKIVYVGPKEFRVLVYRLTIIGVLVLIGFNFGSWFYLYTASALNPKVPLKNFASILNTSSTQRDLELNVENEIIIIKSSELKDWLELYPRAYSGEQDLRITSKFNDYLIRLATNINIEPVDAKFEFQDANKTAAFRQSVQGKRLNITKSVAAVISALRENKPSAQLVIDTVEPEITLEKINDLGIKTLIARGESDFHGSTKARVNNIRTGSSKFNGVIIKPGEVFSFNNVLGSVDEKTGYLAELVIKSGRVVPELGGGLCQLSTTVFRAAILAGLPIKERRPHSFPVKYYNPQGFDATIYPEVSDLKFINDTGAHILIQTSIAGTKLFVEFYGSSDGRQITMDGPYQYDIKTSGAMKANFFRTVSYENGDKKTERFDSNYRAPFSQARNPME